MGDCGPSGNSGDAETDGELPTRGVGEVDLGVGEVDLGVDVDSSLASGGLLRVRRHIFHGLVWRGIGRRLDGQTRLG